MPYTDEQLEEMASDYYRLEQFDLEAAGQLQEPVWMAGECL